MYTWYQRSEYTCATAAVRVDVVSFFFAFVVKCVGFFFAVRVFYLPDTIRFIYMESRVQKAKNEGFGGKVVRTTVVVVPV